MKRRRIHQPHGNRRKRALGKSTPLHEAARSGDEARVAEIVDELERTGCAMAIDARDEHGRAPIHIAAWASKSSAVEVLLKAGADSNVAAQDEMTALHFASQSGCAAAARALLLSGARVDAKLAKSLRTPLHVAAAKGHVEVVEALLDAGASIASTTRQDQTPLDLSSSEPVRTLLLREQLEQQEENSNDSDSEME